MLTSVNCFMSVANTVRVQESFLAGMEKRALIWMAGRLPRAINSDHLTVLGLSAMIAAALAY